MFHAITCKFNPYTRMKLIVTILAICFLAACSGGKQQSTMADDNTEAADTTMMSDSTYNPFPLLAYPEGWYLGAGNANIPHDAVFIAYPHLDLHYSTFETVTREYGGPAFYRELDYKNGAMQSEPGYGTTTYLDSILQHVPQAHVMLFHWNNTVRRDSTQRGYDMDLYFLSDGDSLRVIYGIKFLPGVIASPF